MKSSSCPHEAGEGDLPGCTRCPAGLRPRQKLSQLMLRGDFSLTSGVRRSLKRKYPNRGGWGRRCCIPPPLRLVSQRDLCSGEGYVIDAHLVDGSVSVCPVVYVLHQGYAGNWFLYGYGIQQPVVQICCYDVAALADRPLPPGVLLASTQMSWMSFSVAIAMPACAPLLPSSRRVTRPRT